MPCGQWEIGPMISTAMGAAIGTGAAFDRGRDFAAWLGLVPRQYSTGDPNEATTRVSINRPDTYERLPRTCEKSFANSSRYIHLGRGCVKTHFGRDFQEYFSGICCSGEHLTDSAEALISTENIFPKNSRKSEFSHSRGRSCRSGTFGAPTLQRSLL